MSFFKIKQVILVELSYMEINYFLQTLLLRTLTHLGTNDRSDQVFNIWCRIIKSLPIIVRRDQNDGLLLQLVDKMIFRPFLIADVILRNLYFVSECILFSRNGLVQHRITICIPYLLSYCLNHRQIT